MNLLQKITQVITSFIIIVSIILFPNNIYSMQNNEETPKEVIIGGELLQIEMATDKVMVYGISEDNKLKNYDLIESVSGPIVKKVFNKNKVYIKNRTQIISLLISMSSNETVKLNIIRNKNKINLNLNKEELNHSYLIDKIPSSATLTYIDPIKHKFGAVGHTVESNETKDIISKSGEIYLATVGVLQKSKVNYVGNIIGEKVYNCQGNVNNYDECGINGIVKSSEILKNKEIYKVAQPEEVKTGVAHVVIKHNPKEEKVFYEIKITKVNKQNIKAEKGFEFEVKDKELIKGYGGIVQGMSGAPIIQNGKIIGALSHVNQNDTVEGSGVYIKWMMED
ncbi:MAG: SpoIVB peptidase S55 domain-containing protein [Paraclostridium sp.]